MKILVTVGVDSLFDSIWDNAAQRPESLPGKREDYDRADSAWAYWHMLNKRIRDEYPQAGLSIDLVWSPVQAAPLRGDHSVVVTLNQSEVDDSEWDADEVQSVVEEIEDDTWAAYGGDGSEGTWLRKAPEQAPPATYRCVSADCGWTGPMNDLADEWVHEDEREDDDEYRLACPKCTGAVEEVAGGE